MKQQVRQLLRQLERFGVPHEQLQEQTCCKCSKASAACAAGVCLAPVTHAMEALLNKKVCR